MDIDQILETLDWFSEWFPRIEGKIAFGTSGNEAICATGFQFEEFLVILAVFRERRGGLREEVFVVDPTRETRADRLRAVHRGKNLATAPFLNPNVMKTEIAAQGGSFPKAAAGHIERVVGRAQENPSRRFRTLLLKDTYLSEAVTFGGWSVWIFKG